MASEPTVPVRQPKSAGAPESKGERTRARLKEAALTVLAERGFHNMRVSDVCATANVSLGNFYIYFPDKTKITQEVMCEFIRESASEVFDGLHYEDPHDAVLETNRRYIRVLESAGRLGRALGETLYAIPEVRQTWQQETAKCAKLIANAVARRCPGSRPYKKARTLAALALQGMMDSILLSYFAWEDPAVREAAGTPEDMAEHLSVLWYRGMYGCDPPESKVKRGRSMTRLRLGPASKQKRGKRTHG